MKFAIKHQEVIIREYRNGKSTYEIAEMLKTYPGKISRALKHLHIPIRTASEAQKNCLKNNRRKHPTEGKVRSKEDKIKISEGISKAWKKLPKEKKENIINQRKEAWAKMSDEEKSELQKKAHQAIRKSATEGSKMEKHLHRELIKEGYNCLIHQRPLENEKLECDLLIPEFKIVIEVDGPSHSEAVWGDEGLKQTKKADNQKNGLLLKHNFAVIRLKTDRRTVSNKYKRDCLDVVMTAIEEIRYSRKIQVIEVWPI